MSNLDMDTMALLSLFSKLQLHKYKRMLSKGDMRAGVTLLKEMVKCHPGPVLRADGRTVKFAVEHGQLRVDDLTLNG